MPPSRFAMPVQRDLENQQWDLFLRENMKEFLALAAGQNNSAGITSQHHHAQFQHAAEPESLPLNAGYHDGPLHFALRLVQRGHISLFVRLLSHPLLVDSEKLEELHEVMVADHLSRSNPPARGNGTFSRDVCTPAGGDGKNDTISMEQLIFLNRHLETMKHLILKGGDVIDYLHAAGVLTDSQHTVLAAEHAATSEDWVEVLMRYAIGGGESATRYKKDRLLHALLVTGNYRLFNILKDIADVDQLEQFHRAYQGTAEQRSAREALVVKNEGTKEVAHLSPIPSMAAVESSLGRLSPIPEAKGLLIDLSVDFPDTHCAGDLAYYQQNKPDIYRNFSKPKGLALLINNYKFQACSMLRNRDGTDVDAKNIANLLSQLGYCVLPIRTDITAGEMVEVMRQFATHPDHACADSSVVVVLTHGEYDHLTGVDGSRCNLHRFTASLNAKNCPLLAGKPKIFIIQACRGETHDLGSERRINAEDNEDGMQRNFWRAQTPTSCHNDHPIRGVSISSSLLACIGGGERRPHERHSHMLRRAGIESSPLKNQAMMQDEEYAYVYRRANVAHGFDEGSLVMRQTPRVKEPTEADMLIAFATTPNHVSWRNSMNGSWFIQSICEVFSKKAASEDILTMLTRVNKRVAKVYEATGSKAKQMPEVASRLRRKFYFFPGIDRE